MKSDVVLIDNAGNGFEEALEVVGKTAAYHGLSHRETLQLQLLTEEMLCLARSITGEMKASFWVENEQRAFDLHMTTKTVMDKEKRGLLLQSATSRKNEAARSLLGILRDAFEQAMLTDVDRSGDTPPQDVLSDLSRASFQGAEWDGYERSVLRRLADEVKIGIRGGTVDMTVSKRFA